MTRKFFFTDENGDAYPAWEQKKLGEVAERVTRKNKGNITSRNLTISGESGLIDQLEYFTKNVSSANNEGYYLLKKGEFAYNKSYSKSSPAGATKKLNRYDLGAVSPLYICFKLVNEKCINSEYLESFFHTYIWEKELMSIAVEGARNHGLLNVGVQEFFTLSIPLPSLPEQEKIAEFFSVLDENIELHETKVALLKERKKGYLQKVFSGELAFTDDNGDPYPAWEQKKLGEVAERVTRKNKGNITSRNLTISGEIGLIDQLEYFTKNVSSANNEGYYLLKKGEFAYNKSYSKSSPAGATKKLNRYDLGAVSPLYICFKLVNEKCINSEYLESFFHTYIWEKELMSIAVEGARNHGLLNVGVQEFFTLSIPLPSLPEQEKIAEFFSALDEEIELYENKLALLKEQKKGYLQGIFG